MTCCPQTRWPLCGSGGTTFPATTYDHSLFVSYVAFRIARRWNCDYRMAARMGLLHDLYLYDCHDRTAYPGNHCFYHPAAALNNARELVEMSEKEENIIVSHMWPLAQNHAALPGRR